MNTIQTFTLDLAERAGSAFVTTFFSTFSIAQATSVPEWQKAAAAGGAAAGASVLSLVKGVMAGTRTGTASLSKVVAAALAPTPPVVPAAPQLPAPSPTPAS